MLDALAKLSPRIFGGLATLLLLGATIGLSHLAGDTGTVSLKIEQVVQLCGAVGSLFVGILAFAWIYWLRDSHREKIRFYGEFGRPICGCTERGELMVVKEDTHKNDVWVCPKCTRVVILAK